MSTALTVFFMLYFAVEAVVVRKQVGKPARPMTRDRANLVTFGSIVVIAALSLSLTPFGK